MSPATLHVLLQVTVTPQLLTAVPEQRRSHGSLGTQQAFGPAPPTPHPESELHVFGQMIPVDCPQLLSGAGPHAMPAQLGACGVQQLVPTQT